MKTFVILLFSFLSLISVSGQNLPDSLTKPSKDTVRLSKKQLKHVIDSLSRNANWISNNNVSAIVRDTSLRKIHYITVGLEAIGLILNRPSGPLSISFPYSTTDESGKTTNQVFNQTSSNAFSTLNGGGGLNLNIGGFRYNVNVDFTLNPPNENASLNIGAGFNFHIYLSPTTSKPITISPFVNLVYFRAYWDDYLGSINNQNEYINILGHTANPTYTVYSKFNWGGTTTDAQTLFVYYSQYNFFLCPGIRISNNLSDKSFHFEFKAGYYFYLYEKSGITLTQNNSNQVGGLIPFGTANLTSTLNSQNTLKPYPLSGFYVSFGIDIDALSSTHIARGKEFYSK